MEEQLLSLAKITRSFGAIHALKDVSFDVKPGEVMGLVGENGAGKSSLVKIIGGFDPGFSGQLTFANKQVRFSGPVMAERAGIAIAQQELSLIPTMSVAENVLLVGDNVPKIATKRQLIKLVKPFLSEVGLDYIDPATSVERLSVGERHLVEVARLIAHDPQLLILDEPTAALGETDSIRILEMVERLVKRGKSVIYVSHRLDEIFKICDRITILRDGRSVAVKNTRGLSVSELVNLMLGRELENMFPKRISSSSKTPLLKVRNLWPDGLLDPVDLDIFPGEILGLAGQLGSGTGEILSAIAGAHPIRGGSLEMDGDVFMPKTPNDAIKAKIAYCSEDRKHDGLFLGRPIIENLSSTALKRIANFGILQPSAEYSLANDIANGFTIDNSRLPSEAGVLSGGNQQKVALGKWLAINPKVILVNEPTRGVDVGARAEIYQTLHKLAKKGTAIVIASTDLQEIANLPTRIIAFYRGLKVSELGYEEVSAENILTQITDPFGAAKLER